MSEPHRLPVLVLALGGTIVMEPVAAGGLSVRGETTALLGGLVGELSVEIEELHAVPSSQLRLSDVIELAATIEQRLAKGSYAGIVVTQGTDTLEETAFALDVLLDAEDPVVITGAMRPPGRAGSDAPANLVAAVSVAGSDSARHLGVLVVMNDEIHAARLVRKTHTASPAAFVSVPGPLGWLSEGRARIALAPVGRMRLPLRPRAHWHGSVPLLAVGLGDDGALVEPLSRRPPDGLVVAGVGAGHVPAPIAVMLGELAGKLPVVLSSRVGSGEVPDNAYAFPGSEHDLFRRGLVSGNWLDPWKCRILLELVLRSGVPSPAATFTEIVRAGVARS